MEVYQIDNQSTYRYINSTWVLINSGTSVNQTNWDTSFGWGDHSLAGYATEGYVGTQINNIINSAPGALDTLNELAIALGNDPNFATTITNSLANKVDNSRVLTDVPENALFTLREITDTPALNESLVAISSAWAYNHSADATAHPIDTRVLALSGGIVSGELEIDSTLLVHDIANFFTEIKTPSLKIKDQSTNVSKCEIKYNSVDNSLDFIFND